MSETKLKLIKKEKLKQREDVYDLTIDKTHNFILENGMIAHNCGSTILNIRDTRYGDEGIRMYGDYSQNEIRFLSVVANDKEFTDYLYQPDADPHMMFASKILNKPPEQISKGERRYCKMGTFATLYGSTAVGLAKRFMNGDLDRAKKLISDFFTGFPGIKQFIHNAHKTGLLTGKVRIPLLNDVLNLDMIPYEWKVKSESEKLRIIDDYGLEEYITNTGKYDPEPLSPDLKYNRILKNQIAKAMRVAQNAPIQELASVLGGEAFYQLVYEFRDTSFRMETFQHDAFTADMRLEDFPHILRHLKTITVERIRNKYNIPVGLDPEFGIHGREYAELKSNPIISDNNNIIEIEKLKARKEDWDNIKAHLERGGVKFIKEDILKDKESRVQWTEVMVTKMSLSTDSGKKFNELTLHIIMDFSGVSNGKGAKPESAFKSVSDQYPDLENEW